MRSFSLAVLALSLASGPSQARGRVGVTPGGGFHGGGGAVGYRGGAPRWSGGGAAGRSSVVPAARGLSVTRNAAVARGISSGRRTEVVPGRYYYHHDGGVRYWHYFDRRGLHWYGFYFGPAFWWFPFYAGYWWWYDAGLARWDYWWDGYWWWTGPGGSPYVYADDGYVPYSEYQEQAAGSAGVQPPSSPPSSPPKGAAADIPAKEGGVWKSPDGRRMVQIADGGAYLFDESARPPKFMKFLGSNAAKVRFSGGTAGAPLRILVDFKDGGFALYDAAGLATVPKSK